MEEAHPTGKGYPLPPIPFAQFEATVSRHYALNRRPKTHGRVAHVLKLLGSLVDELDRPVVSTTADLTTDTVTRLVASLGDENRNTVRGKIGSLSAICSYALDEGWLDRAPRFARVRPRKAPPIRERFLPYADMRRLLVHLRDRPGGWKARRDYALVGLASMTGMRFSEAIYMRCRDVSLSRRFVRVLPNVEPLKTERSHRDVPVCGELSAILREWIPRTGGDWLFPGSKLRGPWDGGNVEDRALGRLQSAAKEIGIDWISYHALRHTFATLALSRWKLSLWAVQKILGHTSLRTTEGYLHLGELDELIAEVADVGFRLDSADPARVEPIRA
jgi:integrase